MAHFNPTAQVEQLKQIFDLPTMRATDRLVWELCNEVLAYRAGQPDPTPGPVRMGCGHWVDSTHEGPCPICQELKQARGAFAALCVDVLEVVKHHKDAQKQALA